MAGGSASKNKGNLGERELCKILSEIFGGSFVRVPNSGAFTGGKNAFRRGMLSETQGRIYRGDIITPDHLPKMVIESKFYSEFPYHALLKNGTIPKLEEWIEQCYEAIEPGDFWYVAFKINRKFWSIVLLEEFTKDMQLKNHAQYTDAKGRRYIVTEMTEFMKTNQAEVSRLSA